MAFQETCSGTLLEMGVLVGEGGPQAVRFGTRRRRLCVATKVPPALKKITDGKLTVTYNPGEQADIDSAIGDNVAITITFPDAGDATLVFYGYLKEFTPGELKKGELPTAECSFVVTNDNAGVETAPILTP